MLTKENATRYMTEVGLLHKVSVEKLPWVVSILHRISVGETTMGSMYSS